MNYIEKNLFAKIDFVLTKGMIFILFSALERGNSLSATLFDFSNKNLRITMGLFP